MTALPTPRPFPTLPAIDTRATFDECEAAGVDGTGRTTPRATTWPNGHLIVIDPDARDWRRTGRCDCGGMSAHLPSHAHGPVTDSITFGRILAGRDPHTGAPQS